MSNEPNDLTFGSLGIDEMSRRLIDDPVNRPRCSESDWRLYWLPLFIGAIKVKDDASGQPVVPMMEWTRVARSALQSVDVINPDGETLFTVPPLLRTVTVGERTSRVPLSAMIHHASSLRDAGRVGQAQVVLQQYVYDNLEIEADIRAELATWNGIFERYEESKPLVVDIDALFTPKPVKRDTPTDPIEPQAESTNKESDFGDFEL